MTAPHPDILSAVLALDEAQRNLREALVKIQAACLHERVIHANWRSSNWGPAFKARRLCLCCGLEEQAQHSGWGDGDSDFERLKTKGFHKVVQDEEFYRSRIPQATVP